MVPHHQPEKAEPIPCHDTLQNGEHSQPQGQLHDQVGFKGRLSHSADTHFPQEVPTILLEWHQLSIQGSSL